LAALGLEWVARGTSRAKPARLAGWFFLLIGMAAVFSFGHGHKQDLAGGVGACLDLLAKGLWGLLFYVQAVKLRPGVAQWVETEEQEQSARALLAGRLRRLNRHRAYQEVSGGLEYQAAGAIMTSAEQPPALPGPEAVAVPTVTPPAPPVPPVGHPMPPVSAPAGQPVPPVSAPVSTPVPAPVPMAAPAPASGQPVPAVSTPVAPVVPAVSAPVSTPVPPVVPAVSTPAVGGTVSQIAPSITATVRQLLTDRPELGEPDDAHLAELVAETAKVHGDGGDPTKFFKTVRRLRGRILDAPTPTRKTS